MRTVFGYAAATSTGPTRPSNEDAVVAWRAILVGDEAALASGLIEWDAEALFVVADGMGGQPCGEVASDLIVRSLSGDPPDLTEAGCVAAIRRTNLALHATMDLRPETRGMGAAVAGALLRGAAACWFNVGDCRVYHAPSGGGLVQLSVDDTVASPCAGAKSPLLSAALGGRRAIAPLNPHTGCITLLAEDMLVLCSDGVTAALGDTVLAGIVGRPATPVEMVHDVLDACHARAARDNVSVVVIGPADRGAGAARATSRPTG